MAQRDLTNERTIIQQPEPDLSNERLASTVSDIGQQIIKSSQEAKILENHSKAQMDIAKLDNDFQIKYQGDPFNEQGLKDLQTSRKQILDQYGQEISPIFRGTWNDTARKLSDSNDVTTQAWGYKQASQNAGESMTVAAQNYLDQAGFAGRDVAAGKKTELEFLASFASAREALEQYGIPNLGEMVTAKALKDFDSRYIANGIDGIAEVNPYQAKKMLDSGAFNKELGYDAYDKLQNQVDAAIKAKKTEAAMARLTASLMNGDRLADPSSKVDRKVVDKMYQQSGLLDAFAKGDTLAIQETVGIVKQTSIVPESVQSTLRGYMMNGEPQQKQMAYSVVAEIEKINPAALTGTGGFSEKEVKDAGAYNALRRSGATPDFAMTAVDKANSVIEKDLRDIRQAEVNKTFTGADAINASVISGEFGKGIFTSTPSFLGSQNEAALFSDYKNIYKESYLQYGNPQAAHGAAMAAIKRQHGETYVTGDKTLMQYPPEDYYGLPNLTKEENSEWIRKELETDLKGRGLNVPLEKISLVPTLDARYRTANGNKPQYHVMYEGERDGFPYIDILRDDKNQPLKLTFNTEAKKKEVIKKQQRDIDVGVKQKEGRIKLQNEPNRDYPTRSGIPSNTLENYSRDVVSDYLIKSEQEDSQETEDDFNLQLDDFEKALENDSN